jgi:predicted PurR-regulated permease PerM
VPRSVSAAVLMIAILGIFAALVNFVSVPAQQWFAAAPHTLRVIEKKIRPVERIMSRLDDLRNSAGNIGNPSRAVPQPAAAAPEESGSVVLLDATRGAVLSSVTVIILTLFLLAGGPPMLARMTSAFASDLNSAHIISVIEKVRREVGRFYVTTALINVGLGLATSLAMMGCGMPNPFLWGHHGRDTELHPVRGFDGHADRVDGGGHRVLRQLGSCHRGGRQLLGSSHH